MLDQPTDSADIRPSEPIEDASEEKGKIYCSALQDVIEVELKDIRTRRQRAGLQTNDEIPRNDLRGLALSGGGIRSACVSLGFVQALRAKGLMRYFDYLSTVSGGGYFGAYLSSTVTKLPKQPIGKVVDPEMIYSEIWKPVEKRNERECGQLPRALRFVFGGKYMNKPWQLANRYLSGMFWNNVALLSALIVFGAATALLWRSLDCNWARDGLDLLNLDYDTVAAFLPFFVVLPIWLIAWVVSYAKKGAEAPGIAAQGLLYLLFGSILVGIAMILGNESTSLDPLSRALLGQEDLSMPVLVHHTLFATLGAALLPLLNPKKLLERGTKPRGIADRVIFRVVCIAMLVGVPTAVIAILGKENISFSADNTTHIHPGEIYDWPAFCKSIGPLSTTDLAKDLRAQHDAVEAFKRLAELGKHLPAERAKLETLRIPSDPRNPKSKSVLESDWNWYWGTRKLEREKNELCGKLNDWLLLDQRLLVGLASDGPLTTGFRADAWTPDDVTFKNDLYSALQTKVTNLPQPNPSLKAAIDLATTTDVIGNPHLWTWEEWAGFNHELLFAFRSQLFHDRVRRPLIIVADQWARVRTLGVALVVFLVLGLWVDINATSLHRFYRNRVAFAYIEPQREQEPPKCKDSGKYWHRTGKDRAAYLSRLDTVDFGAPYHLINATLHRYDSRFGQLFEKLDDETVKLGDGDRRSMRSFLFSRRYCGSEVTGFRRTKEYQECLPQFSLADAVALSGAALSPIESDFAPVSWMMTALNVRLGQWLPNPKSDQKRWRPRVITMLGDLVNRESDPRYYFVSDGGFTENLGIVPLLKRRCRTIVALDAGCDPNHEFADLARAVRLARMKDGIQFYEIPLEDADTDRIPLTLETSALQLGADGMCRRHFLLAEIVYPKYTKPCGTVVDEQIGLLVYIKPSFTGDESADLLQYRGAHEEFPHDNTADQLYDDVRVECYRRLGEHMGEQVCAALFKKLEKNRDLAALMTEGFKQLQNKAVEEAKRKDRVAFELAQLAEVLKNGKASNETTHTNRVLSAVERFTRSLERLTGVLKPVEPAADGTASPTAVVVELHTSSSPTELPTASGRPVPSGSGSPDLDETPAAAEHREKEWGANEKADAEMVGVLRNLFDARVNEVINKRIPPR